MAESAVEIIENAPFDEIRPGQSASLLRTLSMQDIEAFAAVSGDLNPSHLDPAFASKTSMHEVTGHGMWLGSLISTLLGTRFPGSGTIYLGQTLRFDRPVHVNDTVTVTVTVSAKDSTDKSVTLACRIVNQVGEIVLDGEARVRAPETKIRAPLAASPRIQVFDPAARLRALIALGADLDAVACGVVHPCDDGSLRGAVEAAEANLIKPVFIGPESKIRAIAEQGGIDLTQYTIISTTHSHEAAARAAEMAAAGTLEALMKGSLHTDELMHAVVVTAALRTGRRFSHAFRFDVPLYSKPLLITDAALNIKPGLIEKRDIAQNAIDLCWIMGIENPKVAILSAVETINPEIASTLDAASLCKMADRGQISGARLDGPLAFDNAVSPEAVRIKHIKSSVAGDADILLAPDLESGNMLAKQLEYLAGASGCGVVLGARVPIALTSRADGPSARMGSALLVKKIAHHCRKPRT
ncbi:MAG: bifunctional enoyl-CoA hydratase/phosphate acetyltransferase [Burkholderiaceae bacterium]|nr:bifunctional enoyl-CoA hydratase/phosphate acetyltransferase [Burkholderiaceae bacterium]